MSTHSSHSSNSYSIHNRDLLARTLIDLPEQHNPHFGVRARSIVTTAPFTSMQSSEFMSLLLEIIESDALPIENKDDRLECQFRAFYLLQIMLRREGNYSRFRENIDLYREKFSSQPMFLFMLAEYYGDLALDEPSFDIAIKYARHAVQELPSTPGVHHLLAEYLLSFVEIPDEDNKQYKKDKEYLEEAQSHVSTAIALDREQGDTPYAKYYSTQARIYAHLGSFPKALQSINQSIEYQDTSTESGKARSLSFQFYKREIILQRRIWNFREQEARVIQDFNNTKSELLSLLGLLAAVVALISTTSTLSTQLNFPDSVALILISGAVILGIFTAFSLTNGKKIHTVGLLFTVGMFLSFIITAFLVLFL